VFLESGFCLRKFAEGELQSRLLSLELRGRFLDFHIFANNRNRRGRAADGSVIMRSNCHANVLDRMRGEQRAHGPLSEILPSKRVPSVDGMVDWDWGTPLVSGCGPLGLVSTVPLKLFTGSQLVFPLIFSPSVSYCSDSYSYFIFS